MKNIKIKKKSITKSNKSAFIIKKIELFQRMITDTIIYIQKYKSKDIITINELNNAIQALEIIFNDLNKVNVMLKNDIKDYEIILNHLQQINNDISVTFRNFGTKNFEDLLIISMGADFVNNVDKDDIDIYNATECHNNLT